MSNLLTGSSYNYELAARCRVTGVSLRSSVSPQSELLLANVSQNVATTA